MNEIVKQILTTAAYAPSGDNSQPWRFEVHDLNIKQFNIPGKDNPTFNFKERGSFIAHGAVIQNIILLSKNFGFEAKINLFPNNQDLNFIAEINLAQNTQVTEDKISNIIKNRETNRRSFREQSLSSEQKNQLLELAQTENEIKLTVLEEKNKIIDIANSASTAERTMLEYRPLHKDFFDLIRWNKAEESAKKYGMLIDTLELLPPQKFIFRWFSNWNLSTILRGVNLPKFIAKENSKIYASGSTMAALIIPNDSPENYIKTGMLLQKIWLKATELGISIQPIAGVLYLAKRLNESGLPGLSPELADLIKESSKKIYGCFGNPNGIISMLFRLGFSEPASARSAKFQPEIKEL